MFSPENEGHAARFLIEIAKKPTVEHAPSQLDHVETQLGKAQAGLSGEGEVQTFAYTTQDKRMFGFPYYPIKQAVDRRFVDGMVKVAKALRRNAP